jgi:hypothetical protein
MTREIHIEREGAGGLRAWIPLDEWCEQVRRANGIRIADDHHPSRNPDTGKAVGFGETAGDAEVWFPADRTWRRIFRWDPAGFVAFRAPADFHDPHSRVRRAASEIARRLRALIIGEGGEIFE